MQFTFLYHIYYLYYFNPKVTRRLLWRTSDRQWPSLYLALSGLTYEIHVFLNLIRVPTARGKQGKWQQQKKLSGKTQGIWKFCQNTGKTQGIWFAQVVNSLILKVEDSIFAAKNFQKFLSQFYVCNSHKLCTVNWDREKIRKTQGI